MKGYFDTSKISCRIILDLLLKKGIKDIVYSPGSRNAPILIGIDTRKDFNTYQCFDERTAGFLALGIAISKQKPVALCCTSGTALYNYAPAVAEAFYQNVPLILLTADRPVEWIDQDDSQTLNQPCALQGIVKKTFDIPEDVKSSKDSMWFVNRAVNEAINLASSNLPGPVHINIRLSDPLSVLTQLSEPEYVRVIQQIEDNTLTEKQFKLLSEILENKKILIVAGFMSPDSRLNKTLIKFMQLPNIRICCETLSNLHLPGNPYAVDRIFNIVDLSSDKNNIYQKMRPDVVISIGGALVSRKLKEFLRNYPPAETWTLGNTRMGVDCFKSLSRHIDVAPSHFFAGVFKYLNRYYKNKWLNTFGDYNAVWNDLYEKSIRRDSVFFTEKYIWSELIAFKYILNNIPDNYNLYLSNGTPIRYGQLFTKRIPHAVYCNRGVSGIEGTSATSMGISCAYNGYTLLITGDLSFGYDTGILGLDNFNKRLKIIVINNQGGGIFRFINTTRNLECREEKFCTKSNIPIEGLARAYNWNYYKVTGRNDLESLFSEFLLSERRCIMEIIVDPETSSNHLVEYFTKNIPYN